MTATLRWLPGPGHGPVPGPAVAITVRAARSRTDWSHARRLLLEYVECAAVSLGFDVAEVAPRVWQEAEVPSARYHHPNSVLLLARHGDEPVGIGGLHVHGDAAEVVRMYVRPPYRRRGIAGALLDGLHEEALRRGVRRLYLGTDPVAMAAAVRLYQRFGFRAGGTQWSDGIEFLRMELVLTDPR